MKKSATAYLMVSPYVIFFLTFVAFPVLFSFWLMFHKWNIISPMEFAGLTNFERLVQDRMFFRSLWNTLVFLVIHIPLQIVVALFFAELLNRNIRFRGFFARRISCRWWFQVWSLRCSGSSYTALIRDCSTACW